MIKLLVVDDHTIFREGIARLMSDESDIRVTGQAADGMAALSMIRSHLFDVVLMDISLGARNGLETLATLRTEQPRLPVIMLSMYVEAQYARLALKGRAHAYLSKDVSREELLRAIRYVATGGVYVTPTFAPMPRIALMQGEGMPAHEALSPREMQVLEKVAVGIPLTEIGLQLCLSVKTIASHKKRVMEKLSVHSNAELVQYVMRHRLLD